MKNLPYVLKLFTTITDPPDPKQNQGKKPITLITPSITLSNLLCTVK